MPNVKIYQRAVERQYQIVVLERAPPEISNWLNEGEEMTKITVIGEHEDRTIEQLKRCAEVGGAPYAVLSADGHVGYSQPIGGAIAYKDFISPLGSRV
jgi:RNA-splicing ligase RtcB